MQLVTIAARARTPLFCTAFCAAMLAASLHAGSQQSCPNCLFGFKRYAELNWHAAAYSNAPADAGHCGDGANGGNGGIRASCGTAVAYAVLARAFPGATNRAARLERVRQALNYGADTHLSGANVCLNGKPRGHDWQSAL